MGNIDYKTEVLKVYPKAYITSRIIFDFAYEIRVPILLIFSKSISKLSFVQEYAWIDAYEKLTKSKLSKPQKLLKTPKPHEGVDIYK